jgi:hypothetical protein
MISRGAADLFAAYASGDDSDWTWLATARKGEAHGCAE